MQLETDTRHDLTLAGLIEEWGPNPSKAEATFVQSTRPQRHLKTI